MIQMVERTVLSEEELALLKVRCLALSLRNNITLLVPNTLVAEVIDTHPVEERTNLPDWVTGMLLWRGRNVPLVSFEQLLGMDSGNNQAARRYVIFNTLNNNQQMPFIAMAVTGVPHLAVVTQAQLEYEAETSETESAVLTRLRYDDESVIVPDLDRLERMLLDSGVISA